METFQNVKNKTTVVPSNPSYWVFTQRKCQRLSKETAACLHLLWGYSRINVWQKHDTHNSASAAKCSCCPLWQLYEHGEDPALSKRSQALEGKCCEFLLMWRLEDFTSEKVESSRMGGLGRRVLRWGDDRRLDIGCKAKHRGRKCWWRIVQ